MPYRNFYRLTEATTSQILASDPKHATVPKDIAPDDVLNYDGRHDGHRFGAMVQILPSEAFDLVGGWDTRFRGWGGEDSAIMRATDTLYWWHKTINSSVFHMWHPMLGPAGLDTLVSHKVRMWEGQVSPNANGILSRKYFEATGHRKAMRELVDGRDKGRPRHHRHHRCSV